MQGLDQDQGVHAPVQVIAVASGKGGVGKSTVSLNLSLALIRRQKRVMLMDADMGLANIDVMLGLQAERTVKDVIQGNCRMADTVVRGPLGLGIIPGCSGDPAMSDMSPAHRAEIIRASSELYEPLDYLIVDMPAGLSDNVTTFARAAQHVAIVVCDEPTSITDAYGLIKVLRASHRVRRFRIIANRVRDEAHGRALFRKIALVADRFLDVNLDYLGAVPEDVRVQNAIQQQRAVSDVFPASRASAAFRDISERVLRWAPPEQASGHLEFFVDRLLQAPPNRAEMAA